MKITLLVSDMSTNCLGRAYILGKVLSRHYQVQIIGPMFGSTIWPPIDQTELNYQAVPARNSPLFIKTITQLLNEIDGEIIYALKPLLSSFGLSLLIKSLRKKRIVLDIDDWEVGFVKWNVSHRPAKTVLSIHRPSWVGWTVILDKFAQIADKITVSNSFLAKRYGGHLVTHGRDVNFLDPSKYDAAVLRKEIGFTDEKLVLFLGTPRPHKGIEELVAAIRMIPEGNVKIILVGVDFTDPFTASLIAQTKDILYPIEMRPMSERPKWLAMADLVVLPQQASPATVGQIPAKLFDAMAMAKPIIATTVSDIPFILEGCGLLTPPGDIEVLSHQISYVLNHPQEARELGIAARQRCVQDYSFEAMERVLLEVFSGL